MRQLLFLLILILSAGCKQGLKTEHYTIGLDPYWYPLELAGQEKPLLAFTIELFATIAKKENLELSIVYMNWDNLLEGLRKKQYSGAASSLPPYIFNLDKYSFSDPFLLTGPVLVVPMKSKIKNVTQLKGKEIGIVPRSSATLILQTYPDVILRAFDSIPLALDGLFKQQVDASVLNVLITQKYIRNLWSKQLKIASNPLSDEGVRLLTLRGDHPELHIRFNRGLKKLQKKGTYKKLLDKWGLSPDGKEVKDIDKKLQALIIKYVKS